MLAQLSQHRSHGVAKRVPADSGDPNLLECRADLSFYVFEEHTTPPRTSCDSRHCTATGGYLSIEERQLRPEPPSRLGTRSDRRPAACGTLFCHWHWCPTIGRSKRVALVFAPRALGFLADTSSV
jgi:hypothetical protein